MKNSTTTTRTNISLNDAIYNKVASNIAYTLRENAGAWITDEEIMDITGAAFLHIAEVMDSYDPEKGASFLTWVTTVGVRFAITEGIKCGNRRRKFKSLDSLEVSPTGCEEDGWTGAGDEAADEYGAVDLPISESSLSMEQEEDAMLWEKRDKWFSSKVKSSLSKNDQVLFGMMLEGLSKDQMVARTGKTAGSIDTARCRLRMKLRAFDREWDGYARNRGLV